MAHRRNRKRIIFRRRRATRLRRRGTIRRGRIGRRYRGRRNYSRSFVAGRGKDRNYQDKMAGVELAEPMRLMRNITVENYALTSGSDGLKGKLYLRNPCYDTWDLLKGNILLGATAPFGKNKEHIESPSFGLSWTEVTANYMKKMVSRKVVWSLTNSGLTWEKYIKENGIKANYVADKIGCHKTTLSHWRHSDRNMRRHLYIRLKEYLNYEE